MIPSRHRLQGSGQPCSVEHQPALKHSDLPAGMVQPSCCPWSHQARGARKVGPGSRPLPEGIEVCCRSQPRDSGAWAGPVPNPTTHCRHSMRLSEKPAGAVHRNWSSGRRSLSERPSTRCSDSRAAPAPGSAGPEGCPASHAPPSCGREEKSLSTFLSHILCVKGQGSRRDVNVSHTFEAR